MIRQLISQPYNFIVWFFWPIVKTDSEIAQLRSDMDGGEHDTMRQRVDL